MASAASAPIAIDRDRHCAIYEYIAGEVRHPFACA